MNEIKWYENTSLDTIKSIIKDNINNASRAFMKIGFYLKDVRDRGLYEADGYTSIWEFAQAEFGISKSSASRFMAINDKFSIDGNSPDLLEQYRDFSSSKLQEMLTLTDAQLEQITITTTVAEIRDIKSADKVVATSQQEINVSESENKPETNSYDDKKPEPGTVIYDVGGSGDIGKYEVVSKDSSFSPKYFTVKDKSESIHNISAESEHWHYSREDAKKDPWYREKTSKPKTEDVIPVSVDDTPKFDFWEGKPVVKKCANCKYNIMPREDYFKEHFDTNEFPCDNCDGDLNNWIPDTSIATQDKTVQETEVVEAEVIQNYSEEEEESENIIQDPEEYRFVDIRMEISTHTNNLGVLRKDNCTDPIRYKTKMRLDAATALLDKLSEPAAEAIPEVIQPELPILKNNDQRKDFIENYTTWPVWIDQIETGEKYYRYDLTDNIAIVVKVSRKHAWQTYKETKDYEYGAEQYYLLGVKSEWSQKGSMHLIDESRTFYECNTNKSALVDYLKDFQKGAKQ